MASYPFACHVRDVDDYVTVVALREAITTDNAHHLCELLTQVMGGGQHKRMVLDLADCDSVSSTGLGVIHFILSSARKAGGAFAVVRANDFVTDVMKATMGASNCPILDAVDDAISLFRSAQGLTPALPPVKNDTDALGASRSAV